jgi:hypothetical protein
MLSCRRIPRDRTKYIFIGIKIIKKNIHKVEFDYLESSSAHRQNIINQNNYGNLQNTKDTILKIIQRNNLKDMNKPRGFLNKNLNLIGKNHLVK